MTVNVTACLDAFDAVPVYFDNAKTVLKSHNMTVGDIEQTDPAGRGYPVLLDKYPVGVIYEGRRGLHLLMRPDKLALVRPELDKAFY